MIDPIVWADEDGTIWTAEALRVSLQVAEDQVAALTSEVRGLHREAIRLHGVIYDLVEELGDLKEVYRPNEDIWGATMQDGPMEDQ